MITGAGPLVVVVLISPGVAGGPGTVGSAVVEPIRGSRDGRGRDRPDGAGIVGRIVVGAVEPEGPASAMSEIGSNGGAVGLGTAAVGSGAVGITGGSVAGVLGFVVVGLVVVVVLVVEADSVVVVAVVRTAVAGARSVVVRVGVTVVMKVGVEAMVVGVIGEMVGPSTVVVELSPVCPDSTGDVTAAPVSVEVGGTSVARGLVALGVVAVEPGAGVGGRVRPVGDVGAVGETRNFS